MYIIPDINLIDIIHNTVHRSQNFKSLFLKVNFSPSPTCYDIINEITISQILFNYMYNMYSHVVSVCVTDGMLLSSSPLVPTTDSTSISYVVPGNKKSIWNSRSAVSPADLRFPSGSVKKTSYLSKFPGAGFHLILMDVEVLDTVITDVAGLGSEKKREI